MIPFRLYVKASCMFLSQAPFIPLMKKAEYR